MPAHLGWPPGPGRLPPAGGRIGDGWRAHLPCQRLTEAMIADPAGALLRDPMVSHRDGYPGGG